MLLKFVSMDKIRTTFSDTKDNLVISGKGLINSFGINYKEGPKKYKKARYAIVNLIMKDISKIIQEFEKFTYKSSENMRPKHDPTGSYFYLSEQIAKCMMRADALNLHVYHIRAEMTGTQHIPISHICSTCKK